MEIRLKPVNGDQFEKIIWVQKHGNWFVLISGVLAILIWAVLTWWSDLPAFILPSPLQVAQRFWVSLNDGSLVKHGLFTLLEVTLGLTSGAVLATLTGYFLAKSPTLEQLLSPYLVASQAIPVVAIAPLMVIWFGPGLFSKVLIAALIVFFPVLVNTVVGIRAISREYYDLMASLRASKLQVLRYLEIPAALPIFFGGLRVGATLSVIGAVVGEFVGSDRGLGFLINVGRGQYDTALVFVSIFALVLMALILYGMVIFLEKRFLGWKQESQMKSLVKTID